MIDPVDRAVRAIARRNSIALVWAQFAIVHVIMLGGLGLLSLYQRQCRLPADECEFDLREDVELKGIPLEMCLYVPRRKVRDHASADGAAASRSSAAAGASG